MGLDCIRRATELLWRTSSRGVTGSALCFQKITPVAHTIENGLQEGKRTGTEDSWGRGCACGEE